MLRARVLTVLIGGVLAACGTPPGESTVSMSATAAPSTPAPSVTASPEASPSEAEPSPAVAPPPPIADVPPPLALEPVASGLSAPISIAPMPDGRLLVNERAGRVVAVDPAGGGTDVALDISDRVLGQGEQGLLGLVLHPRWPDPAEAFIHYTDRQGRTVLSSFVASSHEPLRIDPASEAVMLQVDQPFANHNGGQLAFGPDGYLYLGLGDGGSGGDPFGNGQNPETLLGSIVRVDVGAASDDTDERAGYDIPPDNPFVDGRGAPEVFLYGLRNPWRFSFDRLTGELWIADVGQNAYEEIDRVDPVEDAGGNLGWNVMEGSHCFGDAACTPEDFIGPVSEYSRESGCSVTGGYVYRGGAIGDLAGWYLFGDYCSGVVFGIPSDMGQLTPPRLLLETDTALSSFGEGVDGELYLADLDGGAIYRIVAGD